MSHVFKSNPVVAVACLMAAMLCFASRSAHAITIDMVTVGNAGNANDSTGYGAVATSYQIGKYDVTIGQYTSFLNAVAATDTYSLYEARMGTDLVSAGISRTGSSGSYTYSVMTNSGNSSNRPITHVSWFDAARLSNWMVNGQGSGSTETGAYTLVGGQTSGTAPAANAGAAFFIPTENQWYKAAYYSPTLNSGNGGYYAYATQSNTAPGNVIGSSANQANYNTGVYSVTQSGPHNPSLNYLTDVGAFSGSGSFYGTFDQNGNVYQWNDLNNVPGSSRGLRGGSWNSNASNLSSSGHPTIASSYLDNGVGFRLASSVIVPEPSTWVIGLAGIACGGWQIFRRRRALAA